MAITKKSADPLFFLTQVVPPIKGASRFGKRQQNKGLNTMHYTKVFLLYPIGLLRAQIGQG